MFPFSHQYYPGIVPIYNPQEYQIPFMPLVPDSPMFFMTSQNSLTPINFLVYGNGIQQLQQPASFPQPPRLEQKKEKGKASDPRLDLRKEQSKSFQENNVAFMEKTLQNKLRYRRKNTQSNVVNRIFHFLTHADQNRRLINKLFKFQEEKTGLFYKYAELIADAVEKPIKRDTIRQFCFGFQKSGCLKKLRLFETQPLSLEEFSQAIRKLVRHYFSSAIKVSIITSKKLKREVWKEHLEKVNELEDFVLDPQSEQK